LNLEIKQVYRLREKISYHAVRIFALKEQHELVGNWLDFVAGTQLRSNAQQWQYWEKLTRQCQLIKQLKAGKNIEAIAADLKENPSGHGRMGVFI